MSTSLVFFTRARLVSKFEVECAMPFSIVDMDIQWSSVTWLVSVSNDNVTFSAATTMFVYDSKCLSCRNETSSCQQKVRILIMIDDPTIFFTPRSNPPFPQILPSMDCWNRTAFEDSRLCFRFLMLFNVSVSLISFVIV